MLNVSATNIRGYWRGLGLWNFYFVAKLALYWAGSLNFHAFYNLVFASVLLLPLPPLWLHRLRHVAAIPVGIALLYYESWLPPFRRLLEQPEVLQFSNAYLFELLNRFINWEMVGIGVILFVVFLFLSQWVRVTVLSVSALALVAMPAEVTLQPLVWLQNSTDTTGMDVLAQTAHPSSEPPDAAAAMPEKTTAGTLQDELATFYEDEMSRLTVFEAQSESAPSFDIVFLNICSMAWSDLTSIGLDQHPLLKNMDVIFDEFNSATSYSGPAVRRLLRASCGQPSHQDLYDSTRAQCYLFENLKQLGFTTDALLNHDGKFQDFIDDLTENDTLPAPMVPSGLSAKWTAFDGSLIWSDYETLGQWWQGRQQDDSSPRALLYNTITLHDGNREALADGTGRLSPYETRGQALLDDLHAFLKQLEDSGRQFVVVFIPEHGAALEGDRMQIAGMREIPTPDITHVPVGLKLIGHAAQGTAPAHHVVGPSSYLALSELLARLLRSPVLDGETPDWAALTKDLPQTRAVSENSGTVLMSHSGVPYVRLAGRDWIEYRR